MNNVLAMPADALPTVCPLPPMSAATVEAVRALEDASLRLPQVAIKTTHAFHAGVYARTIMIPAGVVLTGVQISIPTLLIVNGDVDVVGDTGPVRLTGYHVTLGQPGRKQAFYAHADTWLTMLFASTAATVEEAENEFTAEPERLGSRRCE